MKTENKNKEEAKCSAKKKCFNEKQAMNRDS